MLEQIIRKIAKINLKHPVIVLVICLLLTLLAMGGILKIKTESDMEKWMPQDMPIVETSKLIRSLFGSSDTEVVVVRVDPNYKSENAVYDIRDPKVLYSIGQLELLLREEAHVYSVSSVLDLMLYYNGGVPRTKEEINLLLSKYPKLKEYVARDYSSTIIILTTDAGTNEKIAGELIKNIKEDIKKSSFPGGIKASITGMPSLMWELSVLINENNKKTTAASLIGVILVLIVAYASVRWCLLPIIHLAVGVIWTLGAMGYLGIPLNMATTAVGSLLVGIGVAYGIHLVGRYKEEREKNSVETSLKISVVSVGPAVIATSATTMGGFIALLFGSMPMTQQLGGALALGIFSCTCSALFLLPSMLYFLEKGGRSTEKHIV